MLFTAARTFLGAPGVFLRLGLTLGIFVGVLWWSTANDMRLVAEEVVG